MAPNLDHPGGRDLRDRGTAPAAPRLRCGVSAARDRWNLRCAALEM